MPALSVRLLLGANYADCNRIGSLYCWGNSDRGLASHYAGNWPDELICGWAESTGVATAVSVGGDEVPSVKTKFSWIVLLDAFTEEERSYETHPRKGLKYCES